MRPNGGCQLAKCKDFAAWGTGPGSAKTDGAAVRSCVALAATWRLLGQSDGGLGRSGPSAEGPAEGRGRATDGSYRRTLIARSGAHLRQGERTRRCSPTSQWTARDSRRRRTARWPGRRPRYLRQRRLIRARSPTTGLPGAATLASSLSMLPLRGRILPAKRNSEQSVFCWIAGRE